MRLRFWYQATLSFSVRQLIIPNRGIALGLLYPPPARDTSRSHPLFVYFSIHSGFGFVPVNYNIHSRYPLSNSARPGLAFTNPRHPTPG
ncbi:hypothetical protein VN97_g7846 [Penicillium thymicola]|uniref:Uncharacterized protein n=1 Tax=Penicillium thymicola TaxID=293382 RepID=A0AAI9TEG2_PENTH|nr:hypothetical protein VN97_g7846 [Penicillium thymicola]